MNKPWLSSYPQGTPEMIDVPKETLRDLFEASCRMHPHRAAFTNMGTSLTYGQALEKVNALAAYFQQTLKLEKGDRLAIMLPNVLQHPITMFAAFRAGLVVVNVNPLYTARELTQQLKDTGAKAIVVLNNFANVVESVLDKTPLQHVIVTELGDLFPFIKSRLVNFVIKYLKKMVPVWKIPGAIFFKEALKKGTRLPFKTVELLSDDMAFLQGTSGTTGVPKSAILLHRNMMANVEQVHAWVKNTLKDRPVMITALPLYHIFSLCVNCMVMIKLGAENVLITNPRDIPAFVKELKKVPFTAMSGVNTLFKALLNNQEFRSLNFNQFTLAISGGMALQGVVAEQWHQLTGHWIIEGYGLTETCPVITVNPLNTESFKASIGLPAPSTEVEVRDEVGQPVAPGTPGELCVRGPQVMAGYWQRPEETEKVLSVDGWLRTGDIVKMDNEGWFYLVDRKKNMIIVSGFNVYPNEVEEVISQMPEVAEVAVLGVPDQHSTEAVKAFVVKKDPDLTQEKIIAFCADKLTRYKIPKLFEFRQDLPKSNVGKILHRVLREESVKSG